MEEKNVDRAETQIGFLRFYDPNLQRWISRDPIGEDGGFNLYGFIGNDPMGMLDPWGLESYESCVLEGYEDTLSKTPQYVWVGPDGRTRQFRPAIQRKCSFRCYKKGNYNCYNRECKNRPCHDERDTATRYR